jgi:putative transposase
VPRTARASVGGYCYHALNRGNGRAQVFHDADDDLGPWMQWLLTAHVHGYRQRYRGSGHVWQGRFKAFPIEQDEHLRTVLRYVERNPVRAGLTPRAEDWPSSSLPEWLEGNPAKMSLNLEGLI